MSEDHEKMAETFCNLIANRLSDFDFIFTHDLLFTGWNLPYAKGIYLASRHPEMAQVRWFHWVHSIPTAQRDWWNIKSYGPRHSLIFPNRTNQLNVAVQFCGDLEDVKVIPHIKDLRSWFEFAPDTWKFFDIFPSVMGSEIVQVYPASTDRLTAKRVDVLIRIFSYLKKAGKSVCLIVANQWAAKKATGRSVKEPGNEDISRMIKLATRNGLRLNENLIFTSDWSDEFKNGIPRRILRELMLCSNLFVYPTREESFGLIGPEAALSGSKLMVLNKSLTMQMEVHGGTGLYCNFGAFDQPFSHPDPSAYYRDLANLIIAKMNSDEAIRSATHHRLKHNMDYIYLNYYAPLMAEENAKR